MNSGAKRWVRPPGPVERGLRIGLLGGSFNPAHEGHLHASNVALRTVGLDYVWWLVSPQNPLKSAEDMADFDVRLAGARGAAHHNRRIVVTGIEAAFGTRYTADMLSVLFRRFPDPRFVWLMGSDNLLQIPRWRDWKSVFRAVPIAVVARPGTAFAARSGTASRVFRNAFFPADKTFAARPTPAWTIIEARRSGESGTRLRRKTPK